MYYLYKHEKLVNNTSTVEIISTSTLYVYTQFEQLSHKLSLFDS